MQPLVTLGVVAQFVSLLIFGSNVATLVAISISAAVLLVAPAALRRWPRLVLDLVAVAAAMQAAGLVYERLANSVGVQWPQHALAIALAAVAYTAVHVSACEIIAPLVRRAKLAPHWPRIYLDTLQHIVVGAAIGSGIAELIARRQWALLGVAAVPVAALYGICREHAERRAVAEQRREVLDAIDQGVAVVNQAGRITYWSEGLSRLVESGRDRALGKDIAAALPALAKSELPKAVATALAEDPQSAVTTVAIASAAGQKALQVKVVPISDGATLAWQDVTLQRKEENSHKRQYERLSLAAAGASDGLWEWDLPAKELFVSARWKALLGLAPESEIGGPEIWLARVHQDDVTALKEAIEAHVAGKCDVLRHDHRLMHEDGTYRWFTCHGVIAPNATRRALRIGGSMRETTAQSAADHRVPRAGFEDSLTGLSNRALFVEVLGKRLEECKQHRVGGRFALLYLDLDRFKVVNDSLGHLVGDELLVAVSRRLESCVRTGDELARLGGDEFAILIKSLGDDQQANALAFRIQEALRAPFSIGGREVFTTASIGIAFGPEQYADPDEIMRDADTAMYHAKSRGKARHEIFDADMHARVRDRLGLENDLRHAVTNNDFEVHYQPIVALSSGMCVGFESLVRWTRNGEPVSPATFVPMAEELGLIEPLGTWVLQQACRTFADWQRRFPDAGLDCITVNVSSRQLMQHNFLRIVERAVHDAALNPNDLRIEITETALMDSPAVVAESLRHLRDFGVKIYLDDFGTGYSSLSHLHKLPVDALKIDRSFVKSLLLPDRPAIVESVLALARTLNTSVVAEGIETERQARELERLGCTHAQGFLFSRPLSQPNAEAVIVSHVPLGPKRVMVAVSADDLDAFAPTKPFEWPAHVRVN